MMAALTEEIADSRRASRAMSEPSRVASRPHGARPRRPSTGRANRANPTAAGTAMNAGGRRGR